MSQTPAEYIATLNYLCRLTNALVIRQKANEIALANLGVSKETWDAALTEATNSVGWAMGTPESNTTTLENFSKAMLDKLTKS